MQSKPFLILQLRPVDAACENELQAILSYGGIENYVRVRMEKEGVPEVDLNAYSGIIIGGGPSNVSDDPKIKHAFQLKFEAELKRLYRKVFNADFPLLGTCYGVGSLVDYVGGSVSKDKYYEAPGAVDIHISEEGKNDPLLKGLPSPFRAFVGHKEACQVLPQEAVQLAGSETCPYQMLRFQKNIYAVQFHPELDFEGLKLRILVYKHEGYFDPEAAEVLIQENEKEEIIVPPLILKRFVGRYRS
jgi:GMP synthase (glutamine-hydrolysing)